jgi:hypothetical protein
MGTEGISMHRWVLVIVAFIFLLETEPVWAEPWLANRFAQNCASCHAPGRLNRKPSKRRCTLSCQGCHVNPNGGGLRNAYGKWNSERWVRSFYTDLAWNQKSPHPLEKQHYVKKKLPKKAKLQFAKHGAPLVGFEGVVVDEKPYFESSNYTAAKDVVDELSRMTRDDPYRVERRNPIQAGGDLRLFYISQDGNGASSEKLREGAFYPMVFDYGVRVRPIKEKLSFVYEGRAFNGNVSNPGSMDALFAGGAMTRSAYVLVDDLWYNSYAQYGFFRPMFGIMNPNHNAMINDFTQLNQRTRIKSLGFGAAPNVPFGIVNIILPTEGAPMGDISSERGFNATLGLRFVRYGAHLVGTYWSSSNEEGTAPRKRDMWNINAGGVLGRFILNGEVTSVQREVVGLDQTLIVGGDVRYRFWREMYAQLGYATANAAVARNNVVSGTGISPGSGNELSFGIRAMMISGLQLEALWTNKLNKENGFEDWTEDTLQLQMHAYF